MKSEKYKGGYAIKILLAENAFNNSQINKRVRQGEIENIVNSSEGVTKIWRWGEGKYQNVVLVNNSKDALNLARKINELDYVKEVSINKDYLREGFQKYIPVEIQ